MQLYAQVFMEENALDRLEAFASLNGPRFYGLPANEERITLHAKPLEAPEKVDVPGGSRMRAPVPAAVAPASPSPDPAAI